MGAINSVSFAETPGFPLGVLYRRYWFGRWEYVLDNPPDNFPQREDLLISFPIAIALTLLRFFFEYLIHNFAVRTMKLSSKSPLSQLAVPISPEAKKILQKQKEILALKSKKFLASMDKEEHKKNLLKILEQNLPKANKENLTTWIQAFNSHSSRETKLQKFKEAAWRFLFYTSIWVYGIIVVSQTNIKLFDLSNMWTDWQHYVLPLGIRWYYYLSTGLYIHLTIFMVFFDVKRKDFWQMLLHHFVTLVLLLTSFMTNYTKYGACILILHDSADIYLELAKLLNYAKLQKLTDGCFVIFTLVFIISRCVYFPFWLIHSSLIEAGLLFEYHPPWVLFNALLICLLILNIIWATIIIKMVIGFIAAGNVAKDARSDDDDDEEEEVQNKNK